MSNFDHFGLIAPLYARVTYSKVEVLRALAELPSGGRLLDVGGGTGRVASAVGHLVDSVVLADVSLGMLGKAARPSLNPACTQSEALPFASDSFERIIMVDALHHVIHQVDSAREMYRVLKPGGVLVIEEPDIRTFGVKLIALAEKLLLMRSHFLDPEQIAALFLEGQKTIKATDGNAWIIVKKTGQVEA